jgi:hypothetical protein
MLFPSVSFVLVLCVGDVIKWEAFWMTFWLMFILVHFFDQSNNFWEMCDTSPLKTVCFLEANLYADSNILNISQRQLLTTLSMPKKCFELFSPMNASLPTQKSKDSHGNHFLRKLKFPG